MGTKRALKYARDLDGTAVVSFGVMGAALENFARCLFEPDDPEPPPQEMKLEAGCEVKDKYDACGTVIALLPQGRCVVDVPGGNGYGGVGVSDRDDLRVTRAATPEVGDVVQTTQGLGQILRIHSMESPISCSIGNANGGTWLDRDEVTIVMKGGA